MRSNDLRAMSADELWSLHLEVVVILARKIATEKARLQERLRRLEGAREVRRLDGVRPYPPVLPKYQNPKNLAETWSGRGRTPRWLKAQLRAGDKLEDFLIERASGQEQARATPDRVTRAGR
jgi:DNA-binding protein H-NS